MVIRFSIRIKLKLQKKPSREFLNVAYLCVQMCVLCCRSVWWQTRQSLIFYICITHHFAYFVSFYLPNICNIQSDVWSQVIQHESSMQRVKPVNVSILAVCLLNALMQNKTRFQNVRWLKLFDQGGNVMS